MAERRIAIIISVQGAGSAAGKVAGLNNQIQRATHLQDGLTASFVKGNLAARGISFAFNAVSKALTFGASQAVEFDLSMYKVMAVTKLNSEQFKSLNGAIRDLAAVSPKTAAEIANTAFEMSKLGVSSQNIEKSLSSVIGLSVALAEDVQSVGEAMVTVKNVFSLNANELTKVSDQMFQSFANSALNLEKFRIAFGHVGGAARLSGVDFSELLGTMGKLSDAGIRASTIGTQLRRTFLLLGQSSARGSKAIGGMTIRTDGLINVLKKVKTDIVDKGLTQQVFGIRALTTVEALTRSLNDNNQALDVFIGNIRGAEGVVADASKILDQAMFNSLKRVSSAWTELNIVLSDIYKPSFVYFLDSVSGSLNGMSESVNILTNFFSTTSWKEAFSFKGQKDFADFLVVLNALLPGQNQFQGLKDLKKLMGDRSAIKKQGEDSGKDFGVAFIDGLIKGAKDKSAVKAISEELAKEELKVLEESLEKLALDFKLAQAGLISLPLEKISKDADILTQKFMSAANQTKVWEEKVKLLNSALQAGGIKTSISDGNSKENRQIDKDLDRGLKENQKAYRNMFKLTSLEANNLSDSISNLNDEFEKAFADAEFTLKFQVLNDLISSMRSGIDGLGGAIGNNLVAAITGAKDEFVNFGDVFKGMLKDMLAQLISTMIKFAIFKAIIGSLTPGGAGVAFLTALTGFKAASGFDGVVRRPTMMQVGEAGPERVQVTPSSKTAKSNNNQGMTVIVQGSIIDKEGFMRAVNQANQGISRRYVNV